MKYTKYKFFTQHCEQFPNMNPRREVCLFLIESVWILTNSLSTANSFNHWWITTQTLSKLFFLLNLTFTLPIALFSSKVTVTLLIENCEWELQDVWLRLEVYLARPKLSCKSSQAKHNIKGGKWWQSTMPNFCDTQPAMVHWVLLWWCVRVTFLLL